MTSPSDPPPRLALGILSLGNLLGALVSFFSAPWVDATEPRQVVRDLNEYFAEMDQAIRAHRGLVRQFIGDEIEAVFGAPSAFPLPNEHLSPDPDLTPQPGAVKGNFEANGLPKADVTNPSDPSWPRLPAEQAPNFVTASPLLISYKAKETGASPTHSSASGESPRGISAAIGRSIGPATNVEFYGGVAVE